MALPPNILSAFVTLFVTIGPIETAVAFASLTAGVHRPATLVDADDLRIHSTTWRIGLPERAAFHHSVAAGLTATEHELQGKAAGEIRELWAWTCGQRGMSTRALAVPA